MKELIYKLVCIRNNMYDGMDIAADVGYPISEETRRTFNLCCFLLDHARKGHWRYMNDIKAFVARMDDICNAAV